MKNKYIIQLGKHEALNPPYADIWEDNFINRTFETEEDAVSYLFDNNYEKDVDGIFYKQDIISNISIAKILIKSTDEF